MTESDTDTDRELPPAPGPGALELAALLSFATRIEPELIRAVRLRLLPHLDVGAEADLWFSEWVGARTPEAIALLPECLPYLRGILVRRLATDPGSEQVVDIVSELHRNLSPALFLEEQVTWHSLRGDTEKATEHLNRALHALVRERRTGLAGWFAEAWERLPVEARVLPAAWALANVAHAYVPSLDPGTALELTLGDVAAVAGAVGDARMGVLRDGSALHLGDMRGNRAAAILVPDTHPRVVALVMGSGRQIVRVPQGAVVSLAVGTETVELWTGAGHVHVIEPSAPALAEPEAPVMSEEALYTLLGEEARGRAGLGLQLTVAVQDCVRRFREEADFAALTWAVRLAERALEHGYEAQAWPEFGCAAAEAQYLLGAHRGSRRPLERAVEISSRVWSTAGEGTAVRAWTVYGAAHRELFAYTGEIPDLQSALDALQPQVRRMRARGADSGRLLTELLRTYVVFHEADPDGGHLSRALELSGRAIRSPGEEQETALALARVYLARYEVTGYPSELARVEGVARLASPASTATARAEEAAVEAEWSLARFRTEGGWYDLDAAVTGLREALHLLPGDGLLRRAQLSVALADALRLRYRLLGRRDQLDEARRLLYDAMALLPEPSVWRRAALNSLNRCLVDIYREDGDLADLDEAIAVAREAAHGVRACPGLPHVHVARAQLAEALIMRPVASGEERLIDEAVKVLRSVDIDSPLVRPSVRVDHAVALASALLEVWAFADALGVLDTLPEDVPPAARLLIAEIVVHMGEQSRFQEAKADVRAVYRRPDVLPPQRLRAARLWARLAELTDDPDEVVRSHEAVSEAFPPRLLLSLGEREQLGAEWEARVREAAACAIELGRPERALEFLEEREEVLSTPLGRRPATGLPDELTRLWAHASLKTNAAEPPATLRPDRQTATLYRLIGSVRTTPVTAAELLPAASEGPIVVLNAARRRCDALLVTGDGVRSVTLAFDHDMLIRQVEAYARMVARSPAQRQEPGVPKVFGWLWSRTTLPVMRNLIMAQGTWGRIWWCPNGPFTKLPLHVVGQEESQAFVIHSYTPSVRALMSARARTGHADNGGDRPTLVVRTEAATADGEDRFGVMAPEATIVSGSDATVARVTAELSRHRPAYFHYDGHVELDGAPRLHLADGVLDWRDLPADVVPDGALLYLAGCDELGSDSAAESETWRIAAAFQAAGYSQVITVLETIDDDAAGEISDSVYWQFTQTSGRVRPERVAQTLREEMWDIGLGDSPFNHAAVKHLGP